jgi:hypothetical protein
VLFCPTCHNLILPSERATHHCPPLWSASFADDPTSARKIRAHSAEQAAIDYMTWRDEWAANGITDEALIAVVPADDHDASPQYYRVRGELRPEYSADEISAAEIPGDTLVEEIPTEETQPCSG